MIGLIREPPEAPPGAGFGSDACSAGGRLAAGTPRLGIKDPDGDWLERKTTYPDVSIYPDPNLIAAGEDRMLARAVEVMLGEIDRED